MPINQLTFYLFQDDRDSLYIDEQEVILIFDGIK